MRLTSEEQEILNGKFGSVIARALSDQVSVGKFFGADAFVPVTHAHVDGDFEVMGQAGADYLANLVDGGLRLRIPASRNSTCVDPIHAAQLFQSKQLVEGEQTITALMAKLGVTMTNTCIPYQSVYQPLLGEHVAWGDTGAVAYVNAVCGARSNFEAGPFSLLAALTGRTPAYGYHLGEARRANIVCKVSAPLTDSTDWGVLGSIIGTKFRGYWNVPVVIADRSRPTTDDMKHFAASLASYGSIAMFHVVGVTPEAPTLEDAINGREVTDRIEIRDIDLHKAYIESGADMDDVRLVVFTAPQLSLQELRRIRDMLGARRVRQGVTAIITINNAVAADAENDGTMAVLSDSGFLVLRGTCWYVMQPELMREHFGWNHVVTNSAKLANIIPAHGYVPMLRSTANCVDAAVTGRLKPL